MIRRWPAACLLLLVHRGVRREKSWRAWRSERLLPTLSFATVVIGFVIGWFVGRPSRKDRKD